MTHNGQGPRTHPPALIVVAVMSTILIKVRTLSANRDESEFRSRDESTHTFGFHFGSRL